MKDKFDLEYELGKAEYFNDKYDEALKYMEENNIKFKEMN